MKEPYRTIALIVIVAVWTLMTLPIATWKRRIKYCGSAEHHANNGNVRGEQITRLVG